MTIEEVERQIQDAGGVDALRQRRTECMSTGSHHWRELQNERLTACDLLRDVQSCQSGWLDLLAGFAAESRRVMTLRSARWGFGRHAARRRIVPGVLTRVTDEPLLPRILIRHDGLQRMALRTADTHHRRRKSRKRHAARIGQ
jgi:hypothetical protein